LELSLWTGSLNDVQLQIWATWLFYAVLVDLGDAVANEVGVPFEQIYARNALSGPLSFLGRLQQGKSYRSYFLLCRPSKSRFESCQNP
jgi:hypothetical protein